MGIAAGSMTASVALREDGGALDANFSWIASESTVATIWCSVSSGNVAERESAGRVVGSVSHVFRTRYQSNYGTTGGAITSKHKLLYAGRTFDIRGTANEDEGDRVVVIWADEITESN
jgi:SPP1 family predicted phage head-tail adaptor